MAPPPRNIVSLERVGKAYGAGPVLDDVSLGIAAGERIGVVGRNGGGKSTLLDLIARREEPDAGRVTHAAGLRVGAARPGRRPRPRGAPSARSVVGGLADHEWAGDPRIRDVLARHARRRRRSRGFPHGLDTVIGPLSGGERRRIALARLLLDGPELLLLDEPTNHLDLEGVDWLARHLARPPRRGRRRDPRSLVPRRRLQRTWEVDAARVLQHDGGYAAWVLARAERERRRRRDRGAPPQPAAQGARLAAPRPAGPHLEAAFRIDAANALIADEPEPRDRAELLRFATARLGRSVLDVEDATVELGERTTPAARHLAPRARATASASWASTARGKTTLLRLLAGDVDARRTASSRRGQTVRLGGALAAPGGARRRAARAAGAGVDPPAHRRSATAAS